MSDEFSAQLTRSVRARLRELGFAEGRDLRLILRSAAGSTANLPALIADTVRDRPAVVIASGTAVARAMRESAPVLPTVAFAGDLVATGLARSFARPGGNMTGVSFMGEELNAKRLEILAEIVQRPARVLQLADFTNSAIPPDIVIAARRLGLELLTMDANDPAAIDRAFATARAERVAGINVLASPLLNALRRHIFARSEEARLPAIYQWPESARDGGLIAYGPSLNEMFRRLGNFVARILRGTPAGEIPIEQPTHFELVINQRAAAAIGFTFPPALVALADEVIE
jgi:putative ABC transport system substrate-binding protein